MSRELELAKKSAEVLALQTDLLNTLVDRVLALEKQVNKLIKEKK